MLELIPCTFLRILEHQPSRKVNKSVNVVPNPVELDVFNPSSLNREKIAAIRKKYAIHPEDTVVCFCGRLGKEKSVDVLLDYWAQTVKPEDHLKLMILGGGPSLPELKEQAQRLHIDKQVIFTDAIKHEELPEYYGACQLYVTASLSDTNSISMKEAMATGLPVVHIKDPLNAGQVVNGVNGYIYENEKKYKEALAQYEKAVADISLGEEVRCEAYYAAGRMQVIDKNYVKARSAFRQANIQNPTSMASMFWKNQAQAALERLPAEQPVKAPVQAPAKAPVKK